jgi:SAM-dependent methyltransferase
MVDVFRYHEISESNSRILNPLSEPKLDQLGRICRLHPGQRHLDLACGKGEMLCRFSRTHHTVGVGIDINRPFLDAARARARELEVDGRITLHHGDAADPEEVGDGFDIVSCIGATWVGGGLAGTLDLMRRRARPGAWLLVGEVFWAEEPPAQVRTGQETWAAPWTGSSPPVSSWSRWCWPAPTTGIATRRASGWRSRTGWRPTPPIPTPPRSGP